MNTKQAIEQMIELINTQIDYINKYSEDMNEDGKIGEELEHCLQSQLTYGELRSKVEMSCLILLLAICFQ